MSMHSSELLLWIAVSFMSSHLAYFSFALAVTNIKVLDTSFIVFDAI